MLRSVIKYLLYLYLFLLPWQMRWIYAPAFLNGGYWEYGTQSFYGVEFLGWLIVILFSISLFRQREFWRRVFDKSRFQKQGWGALLGLIAVGGFFVINYLYSGQLEITYSHFLWILGAICVGVVLIVIGSDNAKVRRFCMLALWGGGVVQGLFAIWQFFSQQVVANKWLGLAEHFPWQLGANVIEVGGERYLRAYGSLGGANPLGIYLSAIFVLGLILYLNSSNWRDRILISAGQIIILVGLFFSFSRGGYLAAMVGIATLSIFTIWRDKNNWKNLLRQLFYYLLCVLALAFIFWPLLSVRVNSTGRLEEKSLSDRGVQNKQAVEIFSQNLFLGVGDGNYTVALYQINSKLLSSDYLPVHNIYLLMLVELGIVGFSFFFILYFWLFKKIIANDWRSGAVILTIMIAGMFEHWSWSLYPGIAFWWALWTLGLIKTPVDR